MGMQLGTDQMKNTEPSKSRLRGQGMLSSERQPKESSLEQRRAPQSDPGEGRELSLGNCKRNSEQAMLRDEADKEG